MGQSRCRHLGVTVNLPPDRPCAMLPAARPAMRCLLMSAVELPGAGGRCSIDAVSYHACRSRGHVRRQVRQSARSWLATRCFGPSISNISNIAIASLPHILTYLQYLQVLRTRVRMQNAEGSASHAQQADPVDVSDAVGQHAKTHAKDQARVRRNAHTHMLKIEHATEVLHLETTVLIKMKCTLNTHAGSPGM